MWKVIFYILKKKYIYIANIKNIIYFCRYSYKLHSKTHEGEKCYKCDLCPYASISARHLESHMLIHTDQKPYQCDHCFQSFRQKQLLKRHCNLYHNPSYVPPPPQEKTHQCPECERPFRYVIFAVYKLKKYIENN